MKGVLSKCRDAPWARYTVPECPDGTEAGLPRGEGWERQRGGRGRTAKGEATAFTQLSRSWENHSITSAVFCSLEGSDRVLEGETQTAAWDRRQRPQAALAATSPRHKSWTRRETRDIKCCSCHLVAKAKSYLTLLWPHRLWPIRLLCPWDPPGKNTGVGCHSFLRGSSWPRHQMHTSGVSCIARRLIYCCTTVEAKKSREKEKGQRLLMSEIRERT